MGSSIAFLGEREGRARSLALLSKKGGREGSIESQQKFDFFSYDITPKQWFSKVIPQYSITDPIILKFYDFVFVGTPAWQSVKINCKFEKTSCHGDNWRKTDWKIRQNRL